MWKLLFRRNAKDVILWVKLIMCFGGVVDVGGGVWCRSSEYKLKQ